VEAVALATSPQPQKLRVGVFADARLQPQWVVEALRKVAASDIAEIALLAIGESAPPKAPWLLQAYASLDRLAFGGDASQPVDIGLQLPHQSALQASAAPDFYSHLMKLDLDVAFAIGGFDDSQLDGVARYGVWRFCFGEHSAGGEALAGWCEVVQGAPLTGSGIKVRLAAGSGTRLAYQSWSRTYPFSVARNRDQLLRKTSEFALRALREVHRSGHGWLEQCRPLQSLCAIDAPSLGIAELSRIGRRILQRGMEKALYVEQWFLAFRFRETRFGEQRVAPDLNGFTRILPPKDRYWADPFALEKNGRHFVFFEELPFAAGKAHISMIELQRDGRWSAPVKVLERDYHLSYPFLVELDGNLYMIPETAQNRTIEAYRCVDFPLQWRLERVLLDNVRCVDASLQHSQDRWWMFANLGAEGAEVFDDELCLFHAERLLGDWRPHRRNPVKSDARCARPAGQPFWRNGALYRPAQICAPRYGAGISLNRVLRLTQHEYAERQVERILPGGHGSILGLHTLNRAGDLTVVDAFTRRRRI
jgi:hypothetical protein